MTRETYMPRVQIKMNTGTRVMRSKKDKQNTRQKLNLQTRFAENG